MPEAARTNVKAASHSLAKRLEALDCGNHKKGIFQTVTVGSLAEDEIKSLPWSCAAARNINNSCEVWREEGKEDCNNRNAQEFPFCPRNTSVGSRESINFSSNQTSKKS